MVGNDPNRETTEITMTRETFSETEINNLVDEIRNTISSMRKAKLLSRGAVMSHIGKNNAALRNAAVILDQYGYELGDTRETRKLMIWNEYLKMELERITKIPADLRKGKSSINNNNSRIKIQNIQATTAFLSGKR